MPHAPPATAKTPASSVEPLPSFLRDRTPPPVAASRAEPRPADSSARSQRLIGWLVGHLPPRHRARALNYLVLMRMDRPVGALLLLWPTWWALWFSA
ncbi:MAG TPA: 4-hydroxybenzoate octaprenyltransferase, partial [Rhodanobacteraceae bacterium]|nr:4-hydroxybenzoate octaprenyltransferase [Rhodanobacteraceae bacterium]